jgi:hypothetical protein
MSRPAAPLLAFGLLLAALPAGANPRPLPFTYPSEMLQRGGFEVEQFADLTPVPADAAGGTHSCGPGLGNSCSTLLQSTLITELEYGLTDQLELGLYFQFSDNASTLTGEAATPTIGFDGVEQRLRYALARPGRWPIDVEIYGEIAEFESEFEVEAKLILQRRFGRVRLMLNLVAEHESYYSGRQEWVLAPTGGFSWEVMPWLNLGLEYWSHGETGAAAPAVGAESQSSAQFNQQFHSYVGPAVMLQFKRLWWSVGGYVRLDAPTRAAEVGDQYGLFWVRSVVGIDLN